MAANARRRNAERERPLAAFARYLANGCAHSPNSNDPVFRAPSLQGAVCAGGLHRFGDLAEVLELMRGKTITSAAGGASGVPGPLPCSRWPSSPFGRNLRIFPIRYTCVAKELKSGERPDVRLATYDRLG